MKRELRVLCLKHDVCTTRIHMTLEEFIGKFVSDECAFGVAKYHGLTGDEDIQVSGHDYYYYHHHHHRNPHEPAPPLSLSRMRSGLIRVFEVKSKNSSTSRL
jgi:hypothetical protein